MRIILRLSSLQMQESTVKCIFNAVDYSFFSQLLFQIYTFLMAVLQANSSPERIQKRTVRILLVLTTIDIFFLVTSAVIFCTSFIYKDPPFNRKLLLNISAVVGSYGSISSICNCLATFGIKKGRRCFLLPYLAFLPMVISLLFIILIFTRCYQDSCFASCHVLGARLHLAEAPQAVVHHHVQVIGHRQSARKH